MHYLSFAAMHRYWQMTVSTAKQKFYAAAMFMKVLTFLLLLNLLTGKNSPFFACQQMF